MTKIELTDPKEIELYKDFCEHQQEILREKHQWKQLRQFVESIQYGSFTLTVKDGVPYRVDNPIQTVVFTVKL